MITDIQVKKSDLKKATDVIIALRKVSAKEVDKLIDKEAYMITRDIKKGSPFKTGNLRRNIVYVAKDKKIESKAPYSGFLEFGVKKFDGSKWRISPRNFFYSKIEFGLKRLTMDIENALKRTLNR